MHHAIVHQDNCFWPKKNIFLPKLFHAPGKYCCFHSSFGPRRQHDRVSVFQSLYICLSSIGGPRGQGLDFKETDVSSQANKIVLFSQDRSLWLRRPQLEGSCMLSGILKMSSFLVCPVFRVCLRLWYKAEWLFPESHQTFEKMFHCQVWDPQSTLFPWTRLRQRQRRCRQREVKGK